MTEQESQRYDNEFPSGPTEEVTDKSDNELIAEFLGWKRHENGKAFWVPNTYPMEGSTGHTTDHPDWFQFDKRWDWLMPVVDKIEDERGLGKYNSKGNLLRAEIEQALIDFSIHPEVRKALVYKGVVEFIKWYSQSERKEGKV